MPDGPAAGAATAPIDQRLVEIRGHHVACLRWDELSLTGRPIWHAAAPDGAS